MPNCCNEQQCAAMVPTARCPVNGAAGAVVESSAINALITTTALQRFEPGAYRFCASADCEVVYFDEQGRVFTVGDLRVAVWQKQPEGNRVLCYCFGENECAMRAEIARDGQSGAVERVRAHIRAGRCACDVRNPRGICCLGDVMTAIKHLNVHAAISPTNATDTISVRTTS